MAVAARSGGGSRTAPFGLLGDERLARLAAAGHERAFAVVYQRHHQALYRYCRSILRNDADAQDALQSTFAAAFAALGPGRPDAPIRPWLFRIAHNEAVSTLRRRRPTADLSEALDWYSTSVEDQAEERAELDLLLRDLRDLGERQRSALVMRELSGLSHEEIAIALETSVGGAKQTIYEARRSLFEFAEGRAMPCDEIRRIVSDADGRLLRSRRVRAHLRECSACTAFSDAIPTRTRELRALAPPLPAVAAAGLLARATVVGSSHGAGGGLAALAGAAGKSTGAALAANALASVAVVASATVGVTLGMDKLLHAGAPAHATRATGSVTGSGGTPASAILSPSSGTAFAPGGGARGQRIRLLPAGRISALTATGGPASNYISAAGSVSTTALGGRPGAGGTLGPGTPAGAPVAPGQGAGAAKTHRGNGPPSEAESPVSAGNGKPASTGSGTPSSTAPGKSKTTPPGQSKTTPPGKSKTTPPGQSKHPSPHRASPSRSHRASPSRSHRASPSRPAPAQHPRRDPGGPPRPDPGGPPRPDRGSRHGQAQDSPAMGHPAPPVRRPARQRRPERQHQPRARRSPADRPCRRTLRPIRRPEVLRPARPER